MGHLILPKTGHLSVPLTVATMKAYEWGDFAAGMWEFRPLAEQGHADAQSQLGFM